MSQPTLKVYATTWCYDCRRVQRFLNEANISFEWIDIDRDKQAEQFVIQINTVCAVCPQSCLKTAPPSPNQPIPSSLKSWDCLPLPHPAGDIVLCQACAGAGEDLAPSPNSIISPNQKKPV
jgi:glutaredoxin